MRRTWLAATLALASVLVLSATTVAQDDGNIDPDEDPFADDGDLFNGSEDPFAEYEERANATAADTLGDGDTGNGDGGNSSNASGDATEDEEKGAPGWSVAATLGAAMIGAAIKAQRP